VLVGEAATDFGQAGIAPLQLREKTLRQTKLETANAVNAWQVSLLKGQVHGFVCRERHVKEEAVMRGGRARECARRRDSGWSCNVEVLVRVRWEPECIHECLPALARWPDGSDGKSGRRPGNKWHDDATLPRA
jgi:hypothetical protein